jgi:hypothetical protein
VEWRRTKGSRGVGDRGLVCEALGIVAGVVCRFGEVIRWFVSIEERKGKEKERERGEEGYQLKSGRDGIQCAAVRWLERRW